MSVLTFCSRFGDMKAVFFEFVGMEECLADWQTVSNEQVPSIILVLTSFALPFNHCGEMYLQEILQIMWLNIESPVQV
jgi:hypothetical protein